MQAEDDDLVAESRRASRPVGRPPGTTYDQIDGFRHRAMTRSHERLLNRELAAITKLETEQRKLDPTWLLPDQLYKRLKAIQEWLVKIPPARAKNQELLDEALQEIPVAQLEAQLVASAEGWTDEQWALVDAARNKKQPGRWVPAEEKEP